MPGFSNVTVSGLDYTDNGGNHSGVLAPMDAMQLWDYWDPPYGPNQYVTPTHLLGSKFWLDYST